MAGDAPASTAFDPSLPWQLHPQVAIRPEPFGALLYHFGTRKLSFLKNRTIVDIVECLDRHPDARSACGAAGITESDLDRYVRALAVLADSQMLVAQDRS